ncbi:MAG: hypothetical protein F6K36_00075 [Symploca sp. SIO3C6]|uniref:PIG-L family deacetylase n=1 Tax=Symploca sp. SIO1C4 TaxID=2607765 RepID=A0A6B3N8S7_9CYAN|nr:hypothetical protein [Symploca sp. SIO3C6]NER27265.1 hypothetical protein [Symploca sp. SIO1C4]
MNELVVISPHHDDLGFSVPLLLSTWSKLGLSLKFITCFTYSNYAPNKIGLSSQEVTKIRQQEDQEFLLKLGSKHPQINLGLLDAPLRLKCSSDLTCKRKFNEVDLQEAIHLSLQLKDKIGMGSILAPLGLGNHIDHLIVLHACMLLSPDRSIIFYEDLPYAAEISFQEILNNVESIARKIKRPLKSILYKNTDAVKQKKQFANIYRSQITEKDLYNLVQYTRNLGGERIWTDSKTQENLKIIEK